MTMTALAAARTAYLDAVATYTADKTIPNRDAAILAGKAYTDAIGAAESDPANSGLTEDDFFTNPTLQTASRRRFIRMNWGITFPMIWRFVTTAPNQSVVINTLAGGNINIDWDDGSEDFTVTAASPTHIFADAGVYDVAISGHIVGFNSPGADTTLTEVVQWGSSIDIDSYKDAFTLRHGLLTTPTDEAPIFKPGTTCERMFYITNNFNGPLNHWDMTNVVNTVNMFRNAYAFNQPLDQWNVSGVTSMVQMFMNADVFNQPLNAWDVSNVTNMQSMFSDNDAFNQPLDQWDTSSVTNMSMMFDDATAFNQDISGWNVAAVTNNTNFAGGNSVLAPANNPFV